MNGIDEETVSGAEFYVFRASASEYFLQLDEYIKT
jgi:hypothetical protein